MPSEHQKKRAQAKKEAAKAKGGKKKVVTETPAETNGTANGDASKSNSNSKESTPAANGVTLTYEEELCLKLEQEARLYQISVAELD